MKKYAIILDENQKKRVVPTIWLTEDTKELLWPIDPLFDVKKGIIECTKPDKNWMKYNVTKVLKYEDIYNNAVSHMNLNELENISDLSDKDKLKRSRKTRCRKRESEDFIVPSLKKRKRIAEVEDSASESNESLTDSENEDTSPIQKNSIQSTNKTYPKTLNINNLQQDQFISVQTIGLDSERSNGEEEGAIVEKTASTISIDPLAPNTIEQKMELILKKQTAILNLARSLSVKIDMNTKAIQNIESRTSSTQSGNCYVSQDDLKLLSEYFPIDDNPEGKRIMEEIEEKMSDKTFVKLVVTPCTNI